MRGDLRTGSSRYFLNAFDPDRLRIWTHFPPKPAESRYRRGGLGVRASAREQEVVGSIPGRDRAKSVKLVIVALPFGAQDCVNSTSTGPPPVSG